MSRKPPNDTFTRFTSTTPSFSNSRPSPSSSFESSAPSNPPSGSGPFPKDPSLATETSQQRVARLRAEHLRKRAAELSTTDRVVARGRRVADLLHRGTTYTLLGFSALATIVAAYGFVSLVSHNRTQKRAWIEREMDRLEGARAAFLRGEADAEQLHLLEQERAGEELKKKYDEDKLRRKEEGWFGSVKKMFKGQATVGDMGADSEKLTIQERAEQLKNSEGAFEEAAQRQPQRFRMGDADVELRPAAVSESAIPGVGLDDKGRPVPLGKMERVVTPRGNVDSPVLDAIQTQAGTRRPGELDMMAANITSASSSWLSAIFRRSSST